MSYKLMFVLNAAVVVVAGLILLIIPETALSQLGTSERYVSTILSVRLVGVAMITIGALLWFVKDIADPAIQKNLGFALLASTILGLILIIIGSLSVIRSNSWILVLVYVLFALGYGFLLFLKPKMKE
jgi:hypothetical protein